MGCRRVLAPACLPRRARRKGQRRDRQAAWLNREQAIRRDVLVKEHRLTDRQAKALGHILEHGSLTIQDFERLCCEVNRRSLQRDLKAMVDRGLVVTEGETHHLVYRLAGGH